ncbi:MAG: DUF2523 family protein [Polaromonas sp.]
MFFFPFIWSVVRWIFSAIIVKFFVMGAIFVVVSELTPFVLDYAGSLISPGGLNNAFSNIPSGVWFFLDFFALDIGLPLVISAHVSRFLIRRIPVIG